MAYAGIERQASNLLQLRVRLKTLCSVFHLFEARKRASSPSSDDDHGLQGAKRNRADVHVFSSCLRVSCRRMANKLLEVESMEVCSCMLFVGSSVKRCKGDADRPLVEVPM